MRMLLWILVSGCGSLSSPKATTPVGVPSPTGTATGTATGTGTTGAGTGAATGTGTGAAATGTGGAAGTGTGGATGTGTGATTGSPKHSCLEHLAANPAASSGVYAIQPTVGTSYDVYCDMVTDGGGWTLVGSSIDPLSDEATPHHVDLSTLDPGFNNVGIWDGLRAGILLQGGRSDLRFACSQSLGGPLRVDLSFYQTIWYAEITQGTEDQSCFNEGNGVGADTPPARRDNLLGATLPAGDAWAAGYLEGEDACAATDDFTVDFDDRGLDSDEADGTDWGADDGVAKCGAGGGIGFFLFVRE